MASTAAHAAVQHAINAGNALLQAKAHVPHGSFMDWIKANCSFSDRTARAYMRIAERAGLPDSNWQHAAILDSEPRSIRGMLELFAEPRDFETHPARRCVRFRDRSADVRRTLSRDWSILASHVLIRAAEGMDAAEIAECCCCEVARVERILCPEPPERFGFTGTPARQFRRAVDAAIESMLWMAAESVRAIAAFEGADAAVLQELQSAATMHRRRFEMLDAEGFARQPHGDDDTNAELHAAAIDDARAALGIIEPRTPRLPF